LTITNLPILIEKRLNKLLRSISTYIIQPKISRHRARQGQAGERTKAMDVSNIIAEIDAKIASLQQARVVLAGLGDTAPVVVKAKRGRPKGSTNAAKTAKAAKPAKRKRNLSPEGRARIAEAMKRRWAARRAQTPKAAKK
jgi:hypothetical protein